VVTLRFELEPFASTGREAPRLVEEWFDLIVVSLRRDRRFAGIPLHDFELLLADAHTHIEQCLFDRLKGRVSLDDVDVVDGVAP
jgi:hypothetical protein